MTAYDVLQKSLKLLGYTANNGNEQLTARLMNRAVELINTVYEDVSREEEYIPISSLDDEIKLPEKALIVMPYGVAAFIAQSENDGDQQQLWMTIYNRKRRTLGGSALKTDSLPQSSDL